MEKCANCERPIGNLETPRIHNNAILCEPCFQKLHAQNAPLTPNYAPPPQSDVVSTLIPYRNGYALASYYIGLFSLFPCLGAVMGPTAIFLGIKGLKLANKNPNAKGKAHAIVGIVCGSVFGLLWILVDALFLLGLIVGATRPRGYP